MFETLAQKVATTAIAIGSLFFTSISGTNAVFDNPQIDVNGSKITITAQLKNCFTEEMDQLFQSGQHVRFYFRVSIRKKNSDKVVIVKDFYHQIKYSLVDNYYQVYSSETDQTVNAVTLGEAHQEMASITQYEIIDADYLDQDEQYYIQVTAYMKNIRLPGMNEELNLMSYWNGTEPTIQSDAFDKSVLAL